MSATPAELRAEILRLTREFSRLAHVGNRPASQVGARSPGEIAPEGTPTGSIPYAGRVFTEDEVEAAVAASLDFWLTLGPEGEAFESELAATLGVKHTILVNSGSSANLVALSALTSHKLPAAKRIQPGDEVITVAAGFPTTVAPIVQCGAVPVFIDNDPLTANARVEQLEKAYAAGKTKAVMMAHTLGNPFDLGSVLEFCRRHDLWLIEDNCDALGSLYSMPEPQARALGLDHLLKIAEAGTHPLIRFVEVAKTGRASAEALPRFATARSLTAPTGTWGDLSTQSFYPPHHLTLGEGGSVNVVSRPPLKTYAESFRDWGRDCWCASGKDNTCGKRFEWQLGELPKGYDHKYIYSHFGYNLKPLDLQAAIGRQQLKKLPAFGAARRANWQYLRGGLGDLEEYFDFTLPTHALAWSKNGFTWAPATETHGARSDPSWFGFALRVRPSAPFKHIDLARYLDQKKIGNRMLFGGNLVRQPLFVQLKKDRAGAFRVIGDLPGADEIMNRTLFLGVYPGLSRPMLDRVIEVVHAYVKRK